jgi:hypothetical protein
MIFSFYWLTVATRKAAVAPNAVIGAPAIDFRREPKLNQLASTSFLCFILLRLDFLWCEATDLCSAKLIP